MSADRAAVAAFESGLLKGPTLILLLLSNRRAEGCRLTTLSRATGMNATLINSIKREFEADDLAFVQLPARDRRTKKLYLTDKGRKKARALWRALSAVAAAEERWKEHAPTD